MNLRDLPGLLDEMALWLELRGDNPFKIRAFQNASRALSSHAGELDRIAESGAWTTIQGVGKGIAADLAEFVATGKISALESLRSEFPPTLLEVLAVPGLGPKKVKKLYEDLGISTLGELEYACMENRLLALEGFGAKTQEKILRGVQYAKQSQGRFLLSEALGVAQDLERTISSWKEIAKLSIAGSLRRCKETVHDIDLVCSSAKPAAVMKAFVGLSGIEEVIASGETKSSIRIRGMQVDLRVVAPAEFAFALHHFTGSREHHAKLRAHAKKLGFTLNEYGLHGGDRLHPCATEAELYQALKMDFIPPELREGNTEIELALSHKLPKLVEAGQIRGFFHNHTVFSDGKNTVEEMVAAAHERGYEYIGISDHSRSAFYAHGLQEKDIDAQFSEIDRVQKKFPKIRIFKGIESDILADGALDYPEKVLRRFDFIIGSVHSKMKMDPDDMTRRCVSAVENPHLTMLGHPTGRLLLAREGFAFDFSAVLRAAQKHRKIIELNANPHRLDVDWRILPSIRDAGVRVAINPDAHEVDGIGDIAYGVAMARKGGLGSEHVLNTMTAKDIEAYLHGSQS